MTEDERREVLEAIARDEDASIATAAAWRDRPRGYLTGCRWPL